MNVFQVDIANGSRVYRDDKQTHPQTHPHKHTLLKTRTL